VTPRPAGIAEPGRAAPGKETNVDPTPDIAPAAPEDVQLPDLAIVDPHVHLWNLRGYDYFVPDLLADLHSGHRVEASVYVECGMGTSTDPRAAFRPVAETEFVIEQVKFAAGSDHNLAAGIVGGGDLRLGDAIRPVLEAHIAAGRGRFRGLRGFVAWHPDPAVGYPAIPRYAQGNVMQEDGFLAGARCLARLGLVLDIWAFHTQLEHVAAFAAKCPDLPILINHCGGPLGVGPYAGRRAEVFADWSAGLRVAAEIPNLHIKLSGLGMSRMGFHFQGGQATTSDALVAAWRPYIRTCLDAFGAARCIFASNFPVEREAASYRVLLNAYKKMLSDLSDNEQQAIFAGNAGRFYKL
jgi:predicted TIM-barrel fold metal-dependent hydrolase